MRREDQNGTGWNSTPGSCHELFEFLAGHVSINSMGIVQDGKTRPQEKPKRKVAFPSESTTDSCHEPSGGSLFNHPPEKTIL